MQHTDEQFRRKIYGAFKSGSGLKREDVERLLSKAGITVSKNRLMEFGRDSDRGSAITLQELHALISTWAREQTEPAE